MFEYNGKEYKSKAEVVRQLFDEGVINMTPQSKKKIADELGMTIQTVHATLVKHNKTETKPKQSKKVKANKTIVNNLIKETKEIKRVDEENSIKNKHRFKVTFAPNPWGLPITTPPMIVEDENFTEETLYQWEPELKQTFMPE